MPNLDWIQLLSSVRRKRLNESESRIAKPVDEQKSLDSRTETERDHDRVLFSTPVRRLADKTQVFPLEKNDSVRTRLTHSYEVSNLARSIGVAIVYNSKIFDGVKDAERNVPAMLAAVGLAHDIGNPPFGHQGEIAIGSWFQANEELVFCNSSEVTTAMKKDYMDFEGNAQALRILTKLQIISDDFGLNLTCGSLAALMKYPTSSDKTDKKTISRKKFGAFQSELNVCDDVWEQTGLQEGIRHPLAYIMEAADDIAYSVFDAEDAVKKGLVSYYDLIAFLRTHHDNDDVTKSVLEQSTKEHEKHSKFELSPRELNDISMQMFRVYAIGALVRSVVDSFCTNITALLSGSFEKDLIETSDAQKLCKLLKKFSFKHAFKHKTVLELELRGHKTVHSIMDMLWPAIASRGDPEEEQSHKGDPFQRYAYGLISENYRRVFEDSKNALPLPYKQAQLLADMVSGMTDSFAIDFEQNLKSYQLNSGDDS